MKNDFKYYLFKKNKDLIGQINSDLHKFILKTLKMGLGERTRKGKATIALLSKKEKVATKTIKTKDPLNEAEISFEQGKYLEALIMTTVIVEIALRKFLPN